MLFVTLMTTAWDQKNPIYFELRDGCGLNIATNLHDTFNKL